MACLDVLIEWRTIPNNYWGEFMKDKKRTLAFFAGLSFALGACSGGTSFSGVYHNAVNAFIQKCLAAK